jgi:hypothetical protein
MENLSVTKLLQGQIDGNLLNQLSAQIGADPQTTATATQGIVSTLVSALARNASTPEGASSLANALERDHDGSILGNLTDLLGGGMMQRQPSKALDGSGILGHILGGRLGGVIDMVSNTSGLDKNKTGNLMTMLAPIIMGMLGRKKQSSGLDTGGLSDLLNRTVNRQQEQGNPLIKLATRFLDKDADGSALDDIAGMVGGFFKNR